MLGRDNRHAASLRLRDAASLAALAFPVALVLVAAAIAVLPCDAARGCATNESLAIATLAIAAPTLPFLSLLLSNLPATITLLAGVLASVPIWVLIGRAIAERVIADGSRGVEWSGFWRRYGAVCAGWLVAGVVAIALYRRIAG